VAEKSGLHRILRENVLEQLQHTFYQAPYPKFKGGVKKNNSSMLSTELANWNNTVERSNKVLDPHVSCCSSLLFKAKP